MTVSSAAKETLYDVMYDLDRMRESRCGGRV